ncbi:MAG: hypoxanthine phosphoribosyltransferase [Verrucomicrobiales bacterium]|nr:hypoxanthine phosphoribosyltransferase [Verrucomicrobiales bacterium]
MLISQEEIARRITQLAQEISRDFAERETVVVAVLNGTVMFLADLLRHLSFPLRLDFVGVSSYGNGTSAGELKLTKATSLDIRGRDILVVDDILDTGKTLDRVTVHLRQFKPRRLRTCVLLDKKARRQIKIKGDYTGFQIPDEFVVGYGLDFAEKYRNLPFIAVLKSEIFQPGLTLPAPPRPAPTAR